MFECIGEVASTMQCARVKCVTLWKRSTACARVVRKTNKRARVKRKERRNEGLTYVAKGNPTTQCFYHTSL
jgi:hypothetical protein